MGGPVEAVLFCVQSSGSSSSMDVRPPLAGSEKIRCCSRLRQLGWIVTCEATMSESIWGQMVMVYEVTPLH